MMDTKQEQFINNLNYNIENNQSFILMIDDLMIFIKNKNLINVGSIFFKCSIIDKNWSTEINSAGHKLYIPINDANMIYESWKILIDIAEYISLFIKNKTKINIQNFQNHIDCLTQIT